MAYNVLKGSIEGSVDQHGDQEINGIKIFKNTISASVFYDTDAQSPCATIKDVAIQKVKGGSENSILLLGKNQTANATYNFRYENETLHVKRIVAHVVEGSAEKLSNIPSNQFVSPIGAQHIMYGFGLENIRDELQIKVADGITCDEDGIAINIKPQSGLQISSNKLHFNPGNCIQVNSEGQNLSDADLLIIQDVSRNTAACTTLGNLYNSFINNKIPHAHGAVGNIQFKGKKEFESSDNLSYDSTKNTLDINGKVNTNCAVIKQKLVNDGAVYNSIIKITSKQYEVLASDYTILCDASDNTINVKLPAAKNHTGRILIVKKTNRDKYKLNSNLVYISCDEGTTEWRLK